MLIIRKIVFYIFVLLYAAICPLLLLYAMGYIFKPLATEHLVETGAIYFSTLPPGASVYVNNKLSSKMTPIFLNQLAPGKYNIKIFLEGYQLWQSDFLVEAGKAITLNKILLIPKTWKRKVLLGEAIEALIALPGTPFLLAAKTHSLGDYSTYNYKIDKHYMLLGADSEHREEKIRSYFIAEGSQFIMLEALVKGEDKIFWCDVSQPEPKIKDVTELFVGKPRGVMWEANDESNVFAFENSYINRIDVKAGAVYPKYVENVRGFGIFEKTMYVLTNNNVLLSMDYAKNNVKSILNDRNLGDTIFGESGSGCFKIMPLSDDIILFMGEKGQLISNHLPYKFVDEGVRGIEFDRAAEQVLFWQGDKIGILDFSTEITGRVSFEKPPAVKWLFSAGKNISQAFWVYKASHIIFLDGDTVYLLEIQLHKDKEPRFKRLFQVKDKSPIFYSEENGTLYCIDALKGRLVSIEIMPDKGIFPMKDEKNP